MKTTLENVYESVAKFLTPLSLEEAYEKVIKELMKLTGAYCGAMNLYDYKEKVWKIAYTNIHSLPHVVTRKKGFSYKALRLGEPLVVHRKEIIDVHPQLKHLKFRWNVFIPLSYGKKTLGVVVLMHKNNESVKKETLNILKIFGSLATLALIKTQFYKEIKDALEERELFISMAAHELKTPLTTVNAYVQLINQAFQKDQVINPQWITQLSFSTNRLKKLIYELLQIEQIKKGKLNFQMKEICLKEISKQAITDFKFFHPKKKIIFIEKITGNKAIIFGDFDKLLQVFGNILNNAAKFSKDKSKITLTLDYKESHYIIEVKDQGEGIIKEDISRVFNKYYKGKQKSKEGLGLGLFLVRRIVEKHHGKIMIDSVKNKGTTVKITLPSLS